ncbi:Rv1355c family protein [Rhodococcus sp. X156]|uniref:Rv1355c family protein n=1 Tax=Rhodococcus sp. X156 TaxID=2499145 RepID=UPI000FD996B2|nr:Rv1355c family protein [Rhodococcus sp. X156]
MTEDQEWRAQVLDERTAADGATLERLRSTGTRVLDLRAEQHADLARVQSLVGAEPLTEPDRWVHYPWRNTLVGVVGPRSFDLLRLDRNRNKITRSQQLALRSRTVGVVGLSVGHAVAHALALEGLCGQLRLADFDTLALSNLNRIPATLLDLGLNKAVLAARRIAELDPYLPVTVWTEGLTADNAEEFFDGLDLVVEECDSLDVKVLVRELARARGVPVVMETSDRGLLDVERFDVDPSRPLFHGRLGGLTSAELAGLSQQEKIPYVLRVVDATQVSAKMGASLVETGSTLATWPQLGEDVLLGAATVAAVVRRIGTGEPMPSGRVRIDIDGQVAHLSDPLDLDRQDPAPADGQDPGAEHPAGLGTDPALAVVQAVRWAPSGGNIQPWSVSADATGARLHLVRERTTAMDVAHRAGHVALGAALYNARVAAASLGVLGPVQLFPEGPSSDVVAELSFGTGTDEQLRGRAGLVLQRVTNRATGDGAPLEPEVAELLTQAAADQGGQLRLVTDRTDLAEAAELLAAADRIRYLTPRLHAEMVGELRWPGRDSVASGLDVRTLGLAAPDLATLDVVRRADVMAELAAWNAGRPLGRDTRARVLSSSALAVVTVAGTDAASYVRGGEAVQSVWLRAHELGLAVHPTSPVFLYAVDSAELRELSEPFLAELEQLQKAFHSLVELPPNHGVALVLRLSSAAAVTVRSQRLSVAQLGHQDGAAAPGIPGD